MNLIIRQYDSTEIDGVLQRGEAIDGLTPASDEV